MCLGLDQSLLAAREFHAQLRKSDKFQPLVQPELDIVVFAVKAADAAAAGERAKRVFDLAAERNLHLALIELPTEFVRSYMPELEANADTVTCLRSVLMKPEHRDWLDRITAILEDVVQEADVGDQRKPRHRGGVSDYRDC